MCIPCDGEGTVTCRTCSGTGSIHSIGKATTTCEVKEFVFLPKQIPLDLHTLRRGSYTLCGMGVMKHNGTVIKEFANKIFFCTLTILPFGENTPHCISFYEEIPIIEEINTLLDSFIAARVETFVERSKKILLFSAQFSKEMRDSLALPLALPVVISSFAHAAKSEQEKAVRFGITAHMKKMNTHFLLRGTALYFFLLVAGAFLFPLIGIWSPDLMGAGLAEKKRLLFLLFTFVAGCAIAGTSNALEKKWTQGISAALYKWCEKSALFYGFREILLLFASGFLVALLLPLGI